MSFDDYKGAPMSAHTIHVERGAASRFAAAVTDTNPVYHDLRAAREAGFDGIPVPPTWTFASPFLGAWAEDQPADPTGGKGNPMMSIMSDLMKSGGIVLHGEQEFVYHQPVQSGDVLTSFGRINDIYTKESGGKVMTFVVMETVFKNENGEPVVTEIFNLIHRR
ncbi:MAG: MaoC family dehydratase [Deltaproteobacteria bacterium]|nr:MaoC family dehydratase [Deltaproteobacteria bacterium]